MHRTLRPQERKRTTLPGESQPGGHSLIPRTEAPPEGDRVRQQGGGGARPNGVAEVFVDNQGFRTRKAGRAAGEEDTAPVGEAERVLAREGEQDGRVGGEVPQQDG